MFTPEKVIDIYCLADEFCIVLNQFLLSHSIGKTTKRGRISMMSDSEVITIIILFHKGCFRCFKHYYNHYVAVNMKSDFPQIVSYNRFVELMTKVSFSMTLFMKVCCLGKCTGISFVDSTPIRVCKNKRIKRNKVFQNIADVGKSTMGWFYGFKLHLMINDKGEILQFAITQASVDDRVPLKKEGFLKGIFGKLFGDKGYISKKLFDTLFKDGEGIKLVTGLRNNMKNRLMDLLDKVLLRKRSLIETVNDELKNICQIEHSRHRSVWNFITNLMGGLIAYSFFPKKPSLNIDWLGSDCSDLHVF